MKVKEPATQLQIIAGKLFDSVSRQFLANQLITVCPSRGIIIDIQSISLNDIPQIIAQAGENLVDLRTHTILPGFVDAHVHLFLHPYSETSWDDQVIKESVIERTIRAVTHARKTLMAGYTTVRDLGTEGADDADISLRKCLSGSNPLIPGPRYFCANRAIVATGSYGPRGCHHMNCEGVDGKTGAEAADGEDDCRQAVRRQIGAGADWIKVTAPTISLSKVILNPSQIYADYSFRSRLSLSAPLKASKALPTFHPSELSTMISTATSLGVKVAVHLNENKTATNLLTLVSPSPHSIEHGTNISPEDQLPRMARHGVFWVPTLAAYHTTRARPASRWDAAAAAFQAALRVPGLKIACGGDTGVFPHGENALEMKLMVRLGAEPRDVLRWGTLHGWECVRGLEWEGDAGAARIARIPALKEDVRVTGDNDVPFGVLARGFAADIIATCYDPETDFEKAVDAAGISFVMKAGRVYKLDGKEVAL
ncbi:hypothetical protein BU17DRAFT_73058 [Hysterangium stoloniferum]|nr:hypothetical protein BU17DRAFT_73058 [Hysterangium stoloniferum]